MKETIVSITETMGLKIMNLEETRSRRDYNRYVIAYESEMKVQGLERTLADKVFAVCDYFLQDKVKKHSRHISDIYKLLPLVSRDDEYCNQVKQKNLFRNMEQFLLRS